MEKLFFVKDYLADSITDSDAIDKCLIDAEKEAERIIIFSDKDWSLDRAILLSENTTVIIDNCTIKLNDKVFDNIFRGKNVIIDPENPYSVPLDCKKTKNIKIIGKRQAYLSGPDVNAVAFHAPLNEEQRMVGDAWGFKTHLISISNCSGFEVGSLALIKTCGWAMSFDLCDGGYIHDITINSHVKNGDGIDFRSGCHNCLVERIYGYTSDDTVACTALYYENQIFPIKNYLYPSEPTTCITNRTPEQRSISNITIRDIHTRGEHHSVICLSAHGNAVHDIHIENVSEPLCEDWRQATIKIYTGFGDGYVPRDIRNIHVKNVHSSYAGCAVFSNAEVENVVLENVCHSDPDKKYELEFPNGFIIK